MSKHSEHAARAGVATPCTAAHVNFGGGCLNCGWLPDSDTSKATARPWEVTSTNLGWMVSCGRWNAVVGDAAHARLIVERVNGWDALVAERDRLREALTLIACGADGPITARAALEGGKA